MCKEISLNTQEWSMSLARASRQYLGVRALLPPDLQTAARAPTSSDKAYVKGTLWLDTADSAAFMWPGSGNWIALGSGTTGAITTLTGGSGGAISPLAGNISILGTANQLTSTGSAGGHSITFSIPTTFIAPGTIASTTTITSGTAMVATTTVTAGTGITSTTGNIVASAGNISATLGSVAAGTSVTAGTTVTATLGAITATNGNLVFGTAGNKILSTSVATTTTAGANSFGSVTLVGGTATVATTAVTAASLIVVWRQTVGATGAAALGHLCHSTITAGTSFVINANLTADATALATTDVSVVGWMIIN